MTIASFIRTKGARTALLASTLMLGASCKDFLDVNNNPNGPSSATVSANLYLAPMLNWLVSDPQWDVSGGIPNYVQNFTNAYTYKSLYDQQGDYNTDTGKQAWRDVYWSWGQNLVDMNNKAQAEQRWDLLGVGMILKGWGWMELAGLHGDIIVKEAFDQTRSKFDYDSESYALDEAMKDLDSAIVLLQRNDGAVSPTYLSVGDHIYNGDRTKWLKFAYGARAILENRYSNKTSKYKPAQIIADVDKSFSSNADDALLKYLGTQHDDYNFFGPTRQNVGSKRQTKFTVSLMDGTVFGGTVDPRMSRMLAPAPDGQYRGLDPNEIYFGALSVAQRPMNPWGYQVIPPGGSLGRYLFADHEKTPVMTYSQLQFTKAEAAFRAGDKATALEAYKNGIASHIDFVNDRNQDDGQTGGGRCNPTTDCAPPVTPISGAEKAAFLADPNIVPAAANLTMSDIMAQKYIAQWGWAFYEQWMDLRRFHYTDKYPGEAQQAFPGFTMPSVFYVLNAGKPIYRLRPRYNSEYVWNADALSRIQPVSGLADDYQTSELWIVQPDGTPDH
ncbi:MAG TPA: SusD/RagB family nutrient-binding outer membrane lipoprotein [Gemmatimonadaceae bacterium]|nr:SusD/RagB family nutrient-binding outer membrane lipoprotein [Gemmatimonadaceae bacterium]